MIVPDYFGPLVGWRAWSNVNAEGHLKALANYYYWLPGQPVKAQCPTCHGPAKPSMDSYVGMHAFKTLHQLLTDKADSMGAVIGQVYLWGTVVDCTRGYRAEFAYPKALITPHQDVAVLLRQAWKVPVEIGNVRDLFEKAGREAAAKIVPKSVSTWSDPF